MKELKDVIVTYCWVGINCGGKLKKCRFIAEVKVFMRSTLLKRVAPYCDRTSLKRPPGNTTTFPCPEGARINGVPLYTTYWIRVIIRVHWLILSNLSENRHSWHHRALISSMAGVNETRLLLKFSYRWGQIGINLRRRYDKWLRSAM